MPDDGKKVMREMDSSDDESWHKVSLRVIGDAVPLDDLGPMLGIEPTIIGRKGEHIGGAADRAIYDTNIWMWAYPASARVPFETQISALLDRLEPHRSSLREFFSSSGVEGELFLGFSSANGQGAAYFSREILERIVSFGFSITIDLYPPGEGDSE